MKKPILTLSFILISILATTTVHAEPKTELSKKARTLRTYASKAEVIRLFGAPDSAILPRDFKANDLDGTPDLAYVLSWENQPCSRVEVFFNHRDVATGWDGGEFCMVPGKPLEKKYSCANKGMAKVCKA